MGKVYKPVIISVLLFLSLNIGGYDDFQKERKREFFQGKISDLKNNLALIEWPLNNAKYSKTKKYMKRIKIRDSTQLVDYKLKLSEL